METKLQNVQKFLSELCDQTYDNDTFGVHEMLIDITVANIEVILNFKHNVMPKIQSMETAFKTVKLDLDTTKEELRLKDEELKNIKKCSKCPKIEKELAVMKKKQAVNESRIKSIAKILTRRVPASQDSQGTDDDTDTDSDQSTVTKAYNLVSQMLGCDPLPDGESECEEPGKVKSTRKPFKKKSPMSRKKPEFNSPSVKKSSPKINSKEKMSEDSEDDIIVCSVEEIGTFLSPKKRNENNKPASSPVLGKMKTPVRSVTGLTQDSAGHKTNFQNELEEHSFENSFCIPASPGKKNSRSVITSRPSISSVDNEHNVNADLQSKAIQSSDDRPKRTADFWKLKPTHFVDRCSISTKKEGTKLRQSKLTLGFLPKKVDLCDLEEFNGGIRRSQTSTQLSDRRTLESVPISSKNNVAVRNLNANDDDIVMDSPVANISSSRRKGGRLFSSGRKLSYDADVHKVPGTSEIHKFHPSSSENALSKREQGSREEEKGINDSFDCVKKGAASPKYKYRDAPVRKKSERQKLSGWDCENCKKYYEAAGGDDASEEELRKLMNRCSRHRDKNPIRPRTPPGFWDADFPPSPEIEALNKTYMDILPVPKKQRIKQ